ncbi:hypothetical protein [Nonomuraea sp. NPDC001023]|uniref:hypothetical protein n=1 Tax=unclassified Nonomuraea TaxID=2593643 RepID=UPI003319C88C
MNTDESRIAAELRLMADEARPVDALAWAGQARIAARRRRRASWSAAGLVAAASVIASVVAPSIVATPRGAGQVTGAEVDRLPYNSPEQARAVRACMPGGGPRSGVNGTRRLPEHGTAEDFRLLVEYRDQGGSTALVGSRKGFVLCTETEPAIFTYWGFEAPGDLTGFPAALQVDAYTLHAQPERAGKEDVYRVVAGRVKADVRRVEVGWADGRRAEARVAGGFFIARVLTGSIPGASARRVTTLKAPPATVTAYGARAEVLGQEKNVPFRLLGRDG